MIYKKLYNKLILEVDAIDNGVSEAPEMRYFITSGLSSRVGRYNPDWNASKTMDPMAQFKKAMRVTEEELMWQLKDLT